MLSWGRGLALVCAGGLAFAAVAEGGAWDVSVREFPRLAGETDDTARLQRAIDAAGEGGVLYVPRGVYEVAAPLVSTNFCSIEMHKSAVLKAVKPMDFVLKVNDDKARRELFRRGQPLEDYNCFVRGGRIDGNGLASCLALDGFWHYTLRETTFLNGLKYGVRMHGEAGGYELIANNLYFKCLKKGLAGNIAFCSTGGDSHFTDCVVVDYTIGFKVSGGNRLTRCHVWGGPIPPAKPGEDREMLKDSVCYWIEGGDKTCLRDCYADTGKVGFRICSQAQLLGCWYYNNKCFKLDDITIIEHRGGRLLVTDGWFYKDTPHVTMYKSTSPGACAEWSNMTYVGFGDEKLPGQLKYETDAKWDADQPVDRADDWEYLQQGPYVLQAKPGAYAGGNKASTESRYVSTRFLTKRFPDCGPGRELVVRARATTPDTKKVELAITEKDGKVWGAELELTEDWREIRLPLSKLHYFGHWGQVPAFKPGWQPDCRQFKGLRFCFGTWLCPKTTDKAHGLEVASIKVAQ